MGSHRAFYIALGLVATAIISAQALAYYYLESQHPLGASRSALSCSQLIANISRADTVRVGVDTLINYGNNSVRWYNETNIPTDWNFYDLTLFIADCNVEAQFYGLPYNEHFVTGINGVRNTGRSYWTLWRLCQKEGAWTVSNVGADLISISNGEALAWAYQVLSSPYPTEPPIDGAKTVGSCS